MKDNVGIAQKQCNTEDTTLKGSKNYVMVTEVCVLLCGRETRKSASVYEGATA
jgi:hypothetical protein